MDKLTIISGCLFLAADIFAIASLANPDWINTGESAGEGGRQRGPAGWAAGGRSGAPPALGGLGGGRGARAEAAAGVGGLALRGRSSGGGRGAWRCGGGGRKARRAGRLLVGRGGPPVRRRARRPVGADGTLLPGQSRGCPRCVPAAVPGRSAEPGLPRGPAEALKPSAPCEARVPGRHPRLCLRGSVTLDREFRLVSVHSLWQVLNLLYCTDVSLLHGRS